MCVHVGGGGGAREVAEEQTKENETRETMRSCVTSVCAKYVGGWGRGERERSRRGRRRRRKDREGEAWGMTRASTPDTEGGGGQENEGVKGGQKKK